VNPVDIRVCGIVDPARTAGRDPVRLVLSAVRGGCTLIQYRDKEADGRRLIERARTLAYALRDTGVPLLINDRVDVALATGAAGVHLGQSDMHPHDARRLLGPEAIIGLTVRTAEQADEMYRLPVDYAWIGGIFVSTSKDNPAPPIGLDGLSRIAFRARLAIGAPIGAIAGIDHSNAGSVIAAGADGVAVMAALFMVEDPATEAHRLRAIVDATLAARGASA
jgi:thiamine-phosphate diphosphorylase